MTDIKLYVMIEDHEVQCRGCGYVNMNDDYDIQNNWMEEHECRADDVETWVHTREVLAHATNEQRVVDGRPDVIAFAADVSALTQAYGMSLPDLVMAMGSVVVGVGEYMSEFEGDPSFTVLVPPKAKADNPDLS